MKVGRKREYYNIATNNHGLSSTHPHGDNTNKMYSLKTLGEINKWLTNYYENKKR